MSEPGAQHEDFICEAISPAQGTGDAAGMSRGEPGLPARFLWRGREYNVVGIIEKWKTSGPCRNGADEVYLRRHWFRVQTQPHAIMTLYFDRQPKNRKNPKARWFLYSARFEP